MSKRFQPKHLGTDHRAPLPAGESGLDGLKAHGHNDTSSLLSSEEAYRLVRDLEGWRQLSRMRCDSLQDESSYSQEIEAAEFAQLVIRQARRRSRLAVELARGSTRSSSNASGQQRLSAGPRESTGMRALMIARPELAAELRCLIDQSLDRHRQPSLQELHIWLLTRLPALGAEGVEDCSRSPGLGYAAFCAWVRRARIAGGEEQ